MRKYEREEFILFFNKIQCNFLFPASLSFLVYCTPNIVNINNSNLSTIKVFIRGTLNLKKIREK